MKKINKYILILLFMCSFLVVIFPIKIKAFDYTINAYDVNIIVNEDNKLNITEKIKVYFSKESHGIIREIPLRNNIKRLDGTTSTSRVKVSNIKVNDKYSKPFSFKYKVLKIGKRNKTVTGIKNYEISYTYDLGKDKLENYDELYFNIIGTDWNAPINNVTFTITMPKEFDSSKLGFSSGYYDSTDSSKVTYSVDGNIIRGKYYGVLFPYQGITIRLELPEEYFVGESNIIDYKSIITSILKFILSVITAISQFLPIVLSTIFVIISYFIWRKYGKDTSVIETVQFYPPEGFNSAEIGFLYKGRADEKDVVSLLIYLANKGYIKIVETINDEDSSSKKDFKIVKLKDYDGKNENEKLFLEGLFDKKKDDSATDFEDLLDYMKSHNTNSISNKNNDLEVTSKDLKNNFYKTLNKILKKLNSNSNINKIEDKSLLKKRNKIILMIVITLFLMFLKPLVDKEYNFCFLTIITIFLFVIGPTMYFINSKEEIVALKLLFGIISGSTSIFGIVPFYYGILPVLLEKTNYLVIFIISLICIVIMIVFLYLMPKRTAYGIEMLGKIKGFKKFLEVSEKEKLESLVIENPTYFYDILPYTYVLGISDKWIKKFNSITLKSPNWYDGVSSFSCDTFGKFINSTMVSASSVMSSRLSSGSSSGSSGGFSSGSSSGSSGGGSSGGGSGGGGGRSW